MKLDTKSGSSVLHIKRFFSYSLKEAPSSLRIARVWIKVGVTEHFVELLLINSLRQPPPSLQHI